MVTSTDGRTSYTVFDKAAVKISVEETFGHLHLMLVDCCVLPVTEHTSWLSDFTQSAYNSQRDCCSTRQVLKLKLLCSSLCTWSNPTLSCFLCKRCGNNLITC